MASSTSSHWQLELRCPAPPRRRGARPRCASRPRGPAAPARHPCRRRRTRWWSRRRAARRPPRGRTSVRRMSGHSGHGLSASRSLGGSGMISSWCTDAAPWRCAVPRQSAPVSPPPMMTTRLPLAVIGRRRQRALLDQVRGLQVLHGEVDARELPPGHRQVAGQGGPAGQHDGVELRPHLGGRPHLDVGGARRPEAALARPARSTSPPLGDARSLGPPDRRSSTGT